jgi:gas vesicle protein
MENVDLTPVIKDLATKIHKAALNAKNYIRAEGIPNVPKDEINNILSKLQELTKYTYKINLIPEENITHEIASNFYMKLIIASDACSKHAMTNEPLQILDNILDEAESELSKFFPKSILQPGKILRKSLDDQYKYLEIKAGSLKNKISELGNKLDSQKKHFEETSDYRKTQIEYINSTIHSAEESVKSSIDDLEEYIRAKKENLNTLENELSNQQGLLSGKMLAGGYAQQAEEEKKSADSMRNASVLCLVAILAVVIYSLIELSGGEITIERSLVKLGLLLFLLAPAAYLARESTKHRNEHYALKQTALDLNAIGPFIASLNKEEQDLIKTKIAERLFCSNRDKQDTNTFPINAHEVIIKLIERFEPGEKAKKDKPSAAPPT